MQLFGFGALLAKLGQLLMELMQLGKQRFVVGGGV